MTASTKSSGSSSTALSSLGNRLPFPKTAMEIQLDNHYQARVYNSGDTITGRVTIAPLRDIPFDLFEILLLGTTRSCIDNIGVPISAKHVFLKLYMPISESAYPVPRILEAGQTYTLPLNFVVPHHLTINACNHPVASPDVQDHHTALPPTMGAYGNCSGGNGSSGMTADWARDDMAPDMVSVEYAITARVYRETPKGGEGGGSAAYTKIVEAVHPVRILPASFVGAPQQLLRVSDADRLYKLQATKTVRKGLFARSKVGTVTATATSTDDAPLLPAPIVLQPDGVRAASTKAYVKLLFEPARPDAQPPHITGWAAKLTSHTHFSASAISTFPNKGDWARSDNFQLERRGAYATSVPLIAKAPTTTTTTTGPRWEARIDTTVRRDSGYCSNSDDNDPASGSPSSSFSSSFSAASPSPSKSVNLLYSSTLELDIALPMHKRTFLPSFHSCIASRTYSLQLSVTMVPASSSSSTSTSTSASAVTVSITVPLQIVVAATEAKEDKEGLPSFEAALEEAEADAVLRPRVLAVPDTCYQETSTLPGYRG